MSTSVTDVSITSTISAPASTTVQTSTSTFTSGSSTFTTTSESTIVSSTIISSVFVSPSTTIVPAPTTSESSFVAVTSTITEHPATTGGTTPPPVVVITSTQQAPQAPSTSSSSTAADTSSSSTPSAISASGSSSNGSGGGLSTGATIAIAVVIPIVAIALAFCLGLFFWRRRKEKKSAEEQRKNEIEEYGFNPNQDPSLATAAYAETGSEMAEDNSGYRGWGNTSTAQRKPSTTLGSRSRNATGAKGAKAMSESSSNNGGNAYQHNILAGQASDGFHGDNFGQNGDGPGFAAAAGATAGAVAGKRQSGTQNIHRGPSNASSTYSTGPAHSELSDDPAEAAAPAPYYHEEGPYNYIDAQAQHGPYGDGTYGANGQPVIRNVQARRNTRIERAPTYPQAGGIAQNF